MMIFGYHPLDKENEDIYPKIGIYHQLKGRQMFRAYLEFPSIKFIWNLSSFGEDHPTERANVGNP